jgi:heme-degrading monooxygenase HmoA
MDLKAPYYAVIFSSLRTEGDNEYGATAQRMEELAKGMPGYLGIESARGEDGFGITVSYWRDEASISAWRRQGEHVLAQMRGKTEWYAHYDIRVAKVERSYSGRKLG